MCCEVKKGFWKRLFSRKAKKDTWQDKCAKLKEEIDNLDDYIWRLTAKLNTSIQYPGKNIAIEAAENYFFGSELYDLKGTVTTPYKNTYKIYVEKDKVKAKASAKKKATKRKK